MRRSTLRQALEARRRIEQITADVEVGTIYDGRVAKLMDFGAFVNILPGRDGLVHISQISEERVERVSDKLREGDRVKVKVLEVDKQGRIRLSMESGAAGAAHGLNAWGISPRRFAPVSSGTPGWHGRAVPRGNGESGPPARSVPTTVRCPR